MIESENTETKTASEHLARIFAGRTEAVLGSTKIESELDHYGISTLKPFFMQFQSAWEELKRKVNSNKSYDNGRWYIDNEKEEEILSVFLRLGRQDGIGSDIEGAFRKEIFGNSELISQIGREPSILDSSHGSLRFLNPRNRRIFIEHMIRHGITSNIDNPGLSLEKEALEALPEILAYLKSIFQIDFLSEHRDIRSARALSEFIVDQIWSESSQGINAKKMMDAR